MESRGWRPRIWKNFEITRTIYSNSKSSEQFWVTESFYNWRFLISNKLEQLEFKLEKNIWIYKHAGKVRKWYFFFNLSIILKPLVLSLHTVHHHVVCFSFEIMTLPPPPPTPFSDHSGKIYKDFFSKQWLADFSKPEEWVFVTASHVKLPKGFQVSLRRDFLKRSLSWIIVHWVWNFYLKSLR